MSDDRELKKQCVTTNPKSNLSGAELAHIITLCLFGLVLIVLCKVFS